MMLSQLQVILLDQKFTCEEQERRAPCQAGSAPLLQDGMALRWCLATSLICHWFALPLGIFFVNQGTLQFFCITCTGTIDTTGQMHSLIDMALLDSSAQPQCLLS